MSNCYNNFAPEDLTSPDTTTDRISPAHPRAEYPLPSPRARILPLWTDAGESAVQTDAAFRRRRIETAGLTSEMEVVEGTVEWDERRMERCWTVKGGLSRSTPPNYLY